MVGLCALPKSFLIIWITSTLIVLSEGAFQLLRHSSSGASSLPLAAQSATQDTGLDISRSLVL